MRDPVGKLRADTEMEKVLDQPAFLQLLMPLPRGAKASGSAAADDVVEV